MKPIIKNLLIGGAIILVGASLIVKETIDETLAVFDKISIKPYSLPKKLKFSNPNVLGIPQKVSLSIDLVITNPVIQSFSVSGLGIATLESVSVLFKNHLIGTANLQLDEIEIPPQSNFILRDVNFEGNTLSILSNAEPFFNAKLSDFQFVSKVKILDTIYEI